MVAFTTVSEPSDAASAPPTLYVPDGAIAIPVGKHFALADAEDFALVGAIPWYPWVCSKSGRIYARGPRSHGRIGMHRLIVDTPPGFETDHINRDGLDNRRANLRVATNVQNAANRGKHRQHAGRPTSSIYKGVTWYRPYFRWQANITLAGGRHKTLGYFDSEVDAALAYDRAAVAQWGEFARPNFPNGNPGEVTL